MKIVKNFFMVLITLAILTLFFFPSAHFKSTAQEDNVNLHIKVEVSKDGTTWYNYSGTEYSGNQTLSASPGDTIQVRIKIWNTGTFYVRNVTGTGTLTNSSYIASAAVINTDGDANGRNYDGYFFSGIGTGSIAQVDQGTTEASAELLLLSFTLSNNFPAGETVIFGEATISKYTIIGRSDFIDRAYAEGTGRKSAIRIAVNVPLTLPQTGAD